MAETILYEFAAMVLGKLSTAMVDEVKLALGVKNELQKLERTLSSITTVLRDAERQQWVNDSMKVWLSDLEHMVYEIDDLLDEMEYEVTFRKMIEGDLLLKLGTFFSGSNSLVFRFKMVQQIRDVYQKLDDLSSNRQRFQLNIEPVVMSNEREIDDPRETYSKFTSQEILGRDEDMEKVVTHVLSCDEYEGVCVIPIVGVGGVGKTTFAKLIYKDVRIDAHFDKKMWVYVSEHFSMKKILRTMLNLVVLEESSKEMTMEEISIKLNEGLKDSKWFLVLDDWWNENPNDWVNFKPLLDMGPKGCTIVITTRSLKAASIAKTVVKEYVLEGLANDVGLLIFRHLAFGDNHCSDEHPKLESFARNIVEMSKGLPLILTILGTLLKGVTDEREWQHVIQNLENGHEDIIRVLKLSYNQLPSHLKVCFRLLALVPKGAEMYPTDLLRKWMALGVLASDKSQSTYQEPEEEVGGKYLNELVARSLLHDVQYFVGTIFYSFEMHDYLHDLARNLAGHELVTIYGNSSTQNLVDERAKHIVFSLERGFIDKQSLEKVLKLKKARSFQFYNADGLHVPTSVIEKVITNLKSLRVLDLRGSAIEKLPSSIGYMKHLRFLGLRDNSSLEKLPNSVWHLWRLQTLHLGGCRKLQMVSEGIGKLGNLRVLHITSQQTQIPESIGNLIFLNSLIISKSPRLECLPESVKRLKKLKHLVVSFCYELDLLSISSIHALQGLESLNSLLIQNIPKFEGLGGSLGSVTQSLQHIAIIGCHFLFTLSGWIEQLTSLQSLHIQYCPNVSTIGNGFSQLKMVKKLSIINCPRLCRMCEREIGEDWPLICHIPEIRLNQKTYWTKEPSIRGDKQSVTF